MEPENQKSRIEQLLELEQQDGYETFVSYSIALELIGMGKATEALTRFKEIIEHEPEYLPAYLQAGRLLESQGNELSALHFYHRAVAHGKASSDPLTWKEIQASIDLLDEGGIDRQGL